MVFRELATNSSSRERLIIFDMANKHLPLEYELNILSIELSVLSMEVMHLTSILMYKGTESALIA